MATSIWIKQMEHTLVNWSILTYSKNFIKGMTRRHIEKHHRSISRLVFLQLTGISWDLPLSLTRRAYIAFAPQSCDRDRGFGIATFDSSLTSWLTTTRTGLLLTCFMREGIDEVCWVRGVPTEPMTCHVKQKMDSERYNSRAEVSRASHSSWAPQMITMSY